MEGSPIVRDQRTNRRIRAREVRVVGAAGEQLGVLSIEQALERAQSEGFDLVEVNPMAKPPVCKIMDYGKFKYEEKKKASEAKKKQVVVHLKEVKLRPKTEEHDYEFKVRNIKRFLEEANKAKVTIVFRGREITHKELGSAILDDVVKDLKETAVVEQAPRMEGRQMFMILAPNPKVAQRARDQARQQAEAAAKADAAGKKHEGEAGGKKQEAAKREGKPADGKVDARPEGKPSEAAPTAAAPAVEEQAAPVSAAGGTK
ncbi:translation initiation factor IF-3 [Hyalangium rubrum]|uniref:Translation initiation factor IF-3 n=1 Tax=Hyalangium rubrum TaxID=3103134 RepID=A0ABU5HDK9_9BACT|nr:translation initiation factor IF-3 [Hyalangium sp. s54d21]MDY7231544.1 translation initiation factor IF-3 [Hyalangium sp. s54d21]